MSIQHKQRQSLGSPNPKRLDTTVKKGQGSLENFDAAKASQNFASTFVQFSGSNAQTQQQNNVMKGTGFLEIDEKTNKNHLYMSMTKERRLKGTCTREKSQSSSAFNLSKTLRGQSLTTEPHKEGYESQQPYQMASARVPQNDYEIVFDHLNEDSIPDHHSFDLDEQPTVLYVDNFHQNASKVSQVSDRSTICHEFALTL